ncbi:MAG: adenylate/guanylate cyclase domain-containing protein [Proteobacteria bacterium]|nr:CHASE2 domain-containing protein [Desulfobacteraceae bacterium]MBU4013397.1 adenylate/guanylate cyclase domain-containing protein [Pseudomonadota bacterium]MBU4100628.1 adenylate/guanylate cyclase domain-containing protein [Pseudomonadota bacterium]
MKIIAKLYPVLIAFLAISLGVFAYVSGIPFLDIMELKTIDLRFKSRGIIEPGSNIVLAVIDEKSIAKEGKWIWPRSKIADLVNKLSEKGARVIAFDIGFFEPDEERIVQVINSIQSEAKHIDIQNKSFEQYLENLKLKSDNDKLLADAILDSKAKVVLGYFFHMSPAESGHFDEKDMRIHQKNISGSKYKFVRYSSGNAYNAPLIEANMPQSNIKTISEATKYSGYFNMISDTDGVVRWMPAVLRFNDNLYAPLSLIAAGAYLDEPLSFKIAEYGVERLQLGKTAIPTDALGRVLINYRGGEKTFPHIPVTDILKDNIPPNALKDKIVLVGATAVGIYDLRVTPLESVFPGLEIHANFVDSILSNDFLFYPAWAPLFDITAIIVAGLLIGIALPRTGVITGALSALTLFTGYILLCQYMFSEKGYILNLVYPLLVTVLVYVSITAYKYLVEAKQKRFVKNAFSTYLAPSVVKQLIDSPEKLVLGGEQRVITAFFSDVQGFTSISESLTPHELVELLNEFLTEMTDIILNNEGTVDKFEGDAIIAFFGAPNYLENQAEVACKSCVEMQKRLAELRIKWKESNKPELKMRIGLCTGSAVVGNMGSKNRMDYTMMGDTVNTAARLEGVNKIYGIYTLISETTYESGGKGFLTREIDSIKVVGKKEPVSIYELIGFSDDNNEKMQKITGLYSKGLNAYRNRNWEKAVEFFKDVLEVAPDDGPSITMLARCKEFILNPPEKDWDGSFSMKTK